ncbi:hypothetical protein BH09MYX1_BH09MYX1_00430 [soil metagenome]
MPDGKRWYAHVMHRIGLVCVLLSLTACSSDSFSPSGADASADASADAPADQIIDAVADTIDASPATFCATQKVAFCADFDGAGSVPGAAALELTKGNYVSAPQSALARTIAFAGAGAFVNSALLKKAVANGGKRHVVLELDASFPPATLGAQDRLDLIILKLGVGDAVALERGTPGFSVIQTISGNSVFTPVAIPTPNFTHLVWDVHFGSADGGTDKFILTADGKLIFSNPSFVSGAIAPTMTLAIGVESPSGSHRRVSHSTTT